jgi:hypothetical protein
VQCWLFLLPCLCLWHLIILWVFKKTGIFFNEYKFVCSLPTCNGNIPYWKISRKKNLRILTVIIRHLIYIQIFRLDISLDLKMQEPCVCTFQMLVLPSRPHGISNQKTTDVKLWKIHMLCNIYVTSHLFYMSFSDALHQSFSSSNPSGIKISFAPMLAIFRQFIVYSQQILGESLLIWCMWQIQCY